MSIPRDQLVRLLDCGYTEMEAWFLYLVATHSSYFTVRQFLDFAKAKSGKRNARLLEKLFSLGHASAQRYTRRSLVYHLCSRQLYSAIGKDYLRNRRGHELTHIKTRLLALDFILTHPKEDYFETAEAKRRYFIERFKVSENLFTPSNGPSTGITFADRFPLCVAYPSPDCMPVVTFTYVDPEHQNLDAYIAHLRTYRPLFRQLPGFQFLYISTAAGLQKEAAELFFLLIEGKGAFVVGKRQQGYSSSTLHGVRTTLSKLLQQAVEWNYLEENAARGLHIGERVPKKELVFLEPRDALRLIESLPEPCRTVVLVAVLTGLRIGEIAALRWSRVDFFRGVLQVKETYSDETGFGTPKTRSSVREVPLSEPLRIALLAHRAHCSGADGEAFVFASKANTPISPKNMAHRVLRPSRARLGLRPIGWHVLRHTHATWLSESGATIRAAQDILGQSDMETTLRVYTHSVPDSKRRAIANVAALLFPSVPPRESNLEGRQELGN